jgi:hypothetical protein
MNDETHASQRLLTAIVAITIALLAIKSGLEFLPVAAKAHADAQSTVERAAPPAE